MSDRQQIDITGIDLSYLYRVGDGLQSIGFGVQLIGYGIIIFSLVYLIWVFRSTSRKIPSKD